MKTMIYSDFALSRDRILYMALIGVVMFVVLAGMHLASTAVTCFSAIIPMSFLMVFFINDETGKWEVYRMTMPLSRRDAVFGRYLSILIIMGISFGLFLCLGLGLDAVFSQLPAFSEWVDADGSESAMVILLSELVTMMVILIMLAVALPVLMRFGFNRATTYLPVALVVIFLIGITLIDPATLEGALTALFTNEGALVLFAVAGCAGGLVLYFASALLAVRLYRGKEL